MGHLDGAPSAGEPRVRRSWRPGQERTEPAPWACRLGALQASVQEQLEVSDVVRLGPVQQTGGRQEGNGRDGAVLIHPTVRRRVPARVCGGRPPRTSG